MKKDSDFWHQLASLGGRKRPGPQRYYLQESGGSQDCQTGLEEAPGKNLWSHRSLKEEKLLYCINAEIRSVCLRIFWRSCWLRSRHMAQIGHVLAASPSFIVDIATRESWPRKGEKYCKNEGYFTGDPVTKTPHFQCRLWKTEFHPWIRKLDSTVQLKILCATTKTQQILSAVLCAKVGPYWLVYIL